MHLQRLLHELHEGTLDTDAALERLSPARRLTTPPQDRAVLTGLVTGLDPAATGAGTVTLIDTRGSGAGTMRCARDGVFRLTAPPGTYTLLVTAPRRRPLARRLTLRPGVQRSDVDLTPNAAPGARADATTPA